MDEKIVDQLLDELVASLEDAETQSTGIMLFLKGEGIATEQKLAPYLEQAGKASDVRWRAARARIGALLHSAIKPAEPSERKTDGHGGTKKTEKADTERATSSNHKSPAGEKPENASPGDEKADASKGSDDAKGKTSSDATLQRSPRAGNSTTASPKSPSHSQTSNESGTQRDKPGPKN
jgi:hypothetical protein